MDKKIKIRKKSDTTQNITVRVPSDLVEEFNDLALRTNHSRNSLIVQAMEHWVNNVEVVNEDKEKDEE